MFKFIDNIKNKKNSKEKGFSLLELSVAIGIAAIVAAVGITATTMFVNNASNTSDIYATNASNQIANAEASFNELWDGEVPVTPPPPVPPGIPTVVLASNVTSTGGTLTWGAPTEGEVESYIVTLNGDVQGEPLANNVFSYEFKELTVNVEYEAKVFAKSPAGALSQAATLTFTTEYQPIVASGGDKVYEILQDGTIYRVHEFTTVGEDIELNVSSIGETDGKVEYLVIGGGGGSGGRGSHGGSGGGGAGGYLSSVVGESSGANSPSLNRPTLTEGSYIVTVGGGGVAGSGFGVRGGNGGNSQIVGTNLSIIANGGGGGGSFNQTGANGGSGGGGGTMNSGSSGGGAGTTNQGLNGGIGVPFAGGGGGGAAESVGNTRNGGAGITSSITGSPICRAGGGGGGFDNSNSSGSASCGGGQSANGTANTGGGGAGAGGGGAGRQGGSGIVLIRYPIGTIQ